MAAQLTRPDKVETAFSYALLLARTEELECLNGKLRDSFAEASRDAEELRQTNAVKDEVLGLVAHELRGPLTTILGNASILLNRRTILGAATVDLALHDIQTMLSACKD